MAEERRSQRIEVELPARFTFDKNKGVWLDATVINLSTNGFCFRADANHNPAFGDQPVISLSIGFPGEENIELGIKVIWSGKTSSYNCLVGGEILNPAGEAYQKVLDYYTRVFRDRAQGGEGGQ